MIFLLVSPLQETDTGEPSASTATASSIWFCWVGKILDTLETRNEPFHLNVDLCPLHMMMQEVIRVQSKPREQVAVKPRPATSSGATFASEQADFTAAQTACQISVDDCWIWNKPNTLKRYFLHASVMQYVARLWTALNLNTIFLFPYLHRTARWPQQLALLIKDTWSMGKEQVTTNWHMLNTFVQLLYSQKTEKKGSKHLGCSGIV
jgi:hypothetical protein